MIEFRSEHIVRHASTENGENVPRLSEMLQCEQCACSLEISIPLIPPLCRTGIPFAYTAAEFRISSITVQPVQLSFQFPTPGNGGGN